MTTAIESFTVHLRLVFLVSETAVYHMMETGWVKVSQTDVKELHYQYQDEKKKLS